MTFVDDKVVITGVGQSAVGRKLGRSGLGYSGIARVSVGLRVGGSLELGCSGLGYGGIVAGRDVGGIPGAGAVISSGLGSGVFGHDR